MIITHSVWSEKYLPDQSQEEAHVISHSSIQHIIPHQQISSHLHLDHGIVSQHCRLSICSYSGWVWQITIWWWDEQACLGISHLYHKEGRNDSFICSAMRMITWHHWPGRHWITLNEHVNRWWGHVGILLWINQWDQTWQQSTTSYSQQETCPRFI